MKLIDRAKNIILKPKSEWDIIAKESTTVAELYKSYIVPLAAIPAIATVFGLSVIGVSVPFVGLVRTPIQISLLQGVLSYILSLVGVYVAALVISALAPKFSGVKDDLQALKLVAYSTTPSWIAGIFNLFPVLGFLAGLIGLYGLYLLYLGLPKLMKSPKEKSVGYIVVAILVLIVIYLVIGAIAGLAAIPSTRF